jgi:hypothetical protein
MCFTFIYYVDYERWKRKGPTIGNSFVTRYQHDKFYVDIVVEATTKLRRWCFVPTSLPRLLWRRPHLTLLAKRICYLYLHLICTASTCTIAVKQTVLWQCQTLYAVPVCIYWPLPYTAREVGQIEILYEEWKIASSRLPFPLTSESGTVSFIIKS